MLPPISNSFLGQPYEAPLWNDLTLDQRSRQFREGNQRYLDRGAQGHSMRVRSNAFMDRSGVLNPGLAQVPEDRLWRELQFRMRNYPIHMGVNTGAEHKETTRTAPSLDSQCGDR